MGYSIQFDGLGLGFLSDRDSMGLSSCVRRAFSGCCIMTWDLEGYCAIQRLVSLTIGLLTIFTEKGGGWLMLHLLLAWQSDKHIALTERPLKI